MDPPHREYAQKNRSHQRFLECSCMNNHICTQIHTETVQGFSAPQAKMNFPVPRLWSEGLVEAGGGRRDGPRWSRNTALSFMEANLLLLQLQKLGWLQRGGIPFPPHSLLHLVRGSYLGGSSQLVTLALSAGGTQTFCTLTTVCCAKLVSLRPQS